MDFVWLLAGIAFFLGSFGVLSFFANLRQED